MSGKLLNLMKHIGNETRQFSILLLDIHRAESFRPPAISSSSQPAFVAVYNFSKGATLRPSY